MHNKRNLDQSRDESRRKRSRMTKALRRAGLLSIAATAALCAQSAKPAFTTILQEGVGLVGGVDGTLYGTFRNQIVSLTPPVSPGGLWTESVLYQFQDSQDYVTGLVMSPHAGGLPVFYGLTDLGGSSNLGLLFSLTPPASPDGPWTETDLYSFSGIGDTSYASNPFGLVEDSNGVFYGVTAGVVQGSLPPTGNPATVFSLTPPAAPGGSWTQEVLYSFTPSASTTYPLGGVLLRSGPGGSPVLYGANVFEGTVYELAPPAVPGGAWTTTVLCAGGSGSLALGKHGVLYGTIAFGGVDENGSVFSLAPPAKAGDPWIETSLYSVPGYNAVGSTASGIAVSPGGIVYATTNSNSGGYPGGSVFSLTPPKETGDPWAERVVQAFPGSTKFTKGASPGGLTWIGGVLYGSTEGGTSNIGTVFAVVP